MGTMKDDGRFYYPPEFYAEVTTRDGKTTVGCDIKVTDYANPASFPGSPPFKLSYEITAYSNEGKTCVGKPPADLLESLEDGGLSLTVKSFCEEYWSFVDGVPVTPERKLSASAERNQKVKWTVLAIVAFSVVWVIFWEPKLLPVVVVAYFAYRFVKNRK